MKRIFIFNHRHLQVESENPNHNATHLAPDVPRALLSRLLFFPYLLLSSHSSPPYLLFLPYFPLSSHLILPSHLISSLYLPKSFFSRFISPFAFPSLL